MIRTLFFYVVLFVSTIVHGIAAILAGIFRVKNRRVYDWGTQDWARWNLWAAGTPLDVQGLEGVPQGAPVVYVFRWYQRFPVGVVAPADSAITKPEDLAGRVVGVGGHNTTSPASRTP